MRQTRWIYWLCAAQLLLAGATMSGCATTSAASASAQDPALDDDPAVQEVREFHRLHHHGGVTAFVALSVDSLGLPPERQAAVDTVEDDLATRLAPARQAEEAVLSALADGISAGTIDRTKIDSLLDQLGSAAAGVHEASRDALNQLHALLSPSERGTLVEKVRAHWAIWRKVNLEEKSGSHERGTHLGRLAAELALTPDQLARIEQSLSTASALDQAEADVIQAHVDAFATAFVADTFDASSLQTAGPANTHLTKLGAERMARFYEAVAPVLTPEQRERLSGHIRMHLTTQAG